jgi:hypothetical protein
MSDIEPCIRIGDLALSLELLSPALRRRFEVAAAVREHAVTADARKSANVEFKKVADEAKLELAPYVALRLAPRATVRR